MDLKGFMSNEFSLYVYICKHYTHIHTFIHTSHTYCQTGMLPHDGCIIYTYILKHACLPTYIQTITNTHHIHIYIYTLVSTSNWYPNQ